MPGLDQTGPQGNGPRTGRGQGLCRQAEYGGRPGQNPAAQNRKGRGKGPGRKMGNRFGRRSVFGPGQMLPSDEE